MLKADVGVDGPGWTDARIAEAIECGTATVELGILNRQCFATRIGTLLQARRRVLAWQRQRNAQNATVDWQFTTDDARIKLKSLCPSMMLGQSTRSLHSARHCVYSRKLIFGSLC